MAKVANYIITGCLERTSRGTLFARTVKIRRIHVDIISAEQMSPHTDNKTQTQQSHVLESCTVCAV